MPAAAPTPPEPGTDPGTVGLSVATDQDEDGTFTVRCAGEIDYSTTTTLEQGVEAALASSATRAVIDLTEVSFLDSAALGVLVEAHRALERADRPLVLRVATPATVRVLETTGMDRYFTLEDVRG